MLQDERERRGRLQPLQALQDVRGEQRHGIRLGQRGEVNGRQKAAALIAGLVMIGLLAVSAKAAETQEVAKPTISNLEVTAITTETARFSAEIDPGGTDPAFDTTWSMYCTRPDGLEFIDNCGGFESGTVSGTAETVEIDAANLDAAIEYTVHLTASNAGGQVEAVKTFATAAGPPLVKAFAAGPIQPGQATLNGEVAPRGAATDYWFEWGREDCSQGSCEKLAAQDAGHGSYYRWAEARLTGLDPDTTYHFRLVAENALGVKAGSDEEFTTAAATGGAACPNQGQLGTNFLPDCRAWEMVSPPDKNGVSVTPTNVKVHPSADGGAVTFSALGTFGSTEGSAIDSEYLARRTGQPDTNGWATHGIYPLSRPVTAVAARTGNTTGYLNAFSPGLDAAIYRTWRPLTGSSNVEAVSNLYRISGLADGPPGSAELLSDATSPVAYMAAPSGFPGSSLNTIQPVLVGASTDLSRVFFEERLPLTPDALGLLPPVDPETPSSSPCVESGSDCRNELYENRDGGVHLAGRVPPAGETFCDDAGAPACEPSPESEAAISAVAEEYSERVVSADGRRVYFMANGHIYLREDGERTYEVAETGSAQDASRNGSRLFILTNAQMLPADQDGEPDIYLWNREAAPGERLTLISVGPGGQNCYADNFWGASDDGRSAYFACSRQLVPGQEPAPVRAFYRWHEGRLTYVAKGMFATRSDNTYLTNWSSESTARRARISPDGRYVLFAGGDESLAGRGGYTASGEAGQNSLFLYDADTGRIVCVACNPSGEVPKDSPMIAVIRDSAASEVTSGGPHALSDDGRYVFFSSVEPLVPEDTNGTWDAYEYDSKSGETHLISTGTSSSPSYVMGATDNGDEVFFVTRQRLSEWDIDGLYDLYVARVDGGLPEPAPVTAACEGESCLPSPPPRPAAPVSSSEAAGFGNPPRRCRHRKAMRTTHRLGVVRCVKRHRRRPAHKRGRTSHGKRRPGR
ncbi:MAG TPA: fibronectin type III domain-containing protein [Solirubrobacterales bacterium]|nr:fibronectin type III domain-containing protein [Solirubrobacterales bacterium]